MAFVNFDTKEINCKVIYFGPSSSGKTTNLRSIYSNTSSEVRSGILELNDSGGPTQFFDFLPISLGHVRDFHLKLHLFTLPANSLYESVTGVILKGLDGFVFVGDSRLECMSDNIDTLLETKKLLSDESYNVADLPQVIQYNKRDVPEAVPLEILRQELNRSGHPDQEAIALKSIGTMETLQTIAQMMIKKISK